MLDEVVQLQSMPLEAIATSGELVVVATDPDAGMTLANIRWLPAIAKEKKGWNPGHTFGSQNPGAPNSPK